MSLSSFVRQHRHLISAAKRAEWQRIMSQPLDDGRVAYHNKRAMIWFVGDNIVVDGRVWALCYNVVGDREAIVADVRKRLGGVHVVFDDADARGSNFRQ